MRKNKSVKDYSLGRNRRSQGKEISIQLDGWARQGSTHRGSKQTLQNSQLSDRIDRSVNPISQNILKDIINYSNISQSQVRNNKGASTYDRHHDVLSHLSKINKKASMGDVRRDSHKLVIDQRTPSNSITPSMAKSEFFNENRSIQMIQSKVIFQEQPQASREQSSKKGSLNNSISKGQLLSLEKERSELAAKLDELHSIQEGIVRQYSQMISEWEQMIRIEQQNSSLTKKLAQIQIRRDTIKSEIDSSNQILLDTSRQLVDCRRNWESKSNGARTKVLDEAMYSHNQFLRKLTIRAFEETLVFNMKVTIPDYKGKGNIRGIYDQLFRSRLSKKFVMLLKKHRNQMDLYDGQLLNDFTKRLIEIEGQYSRCEGESTLPPDQVLINKMELVVTNLDELKTQLFESEEQRNYLLTELNRWQQLQQKCDQKISCLIEELNSMVKGDYQRETEKAADFRALLAQKFTEKYREFKNIRANREQTAAELHRVHGLLDRLGGDM